MKIWILDKLVSLLFFFLGRIDTIAILLKALKMCILAKALLIFS